MIDDKEKIIKQINNIESELQISLHTIVVLKRKML